MDRLELLPDTKGYSASRGGDIVRSQLDGSGGAYRRGTLGNSFLVTCQWTLSADEYLAFCRFHKKHAGRSTVFIVKLITDTPLLEDHYAAFTGKAVSLIAHSGESYTVRATLEAVRS